jgi:hypothetical protein
MTTTTIGTIGITEPSSLADAIVGMELRAQEHSTSADPEYHEYAAGIRDVLKALQPFLAADPVAWQYRADEHEPWCDCSKANFEKYKALGYGVRALCVA